MQQTNRMVTGMDVVITTLSSVLIVGTTGFALWLWTQDIITVGAIALATSLVIRINNMSGWIMWVVSGIFENIGQVQDGMQTISQPRAVQDQDDAKPLQVPRGEVRFERIGFHYGKGRTVFEGLDLEVRPGEKIGLVGPSGAGKSTLVNLLLRLYDLDSGRILVDGQDIARITQESLREQIGMVTQDTSLLHRSIRDNLLYGRPGATDEELWEAVRKARAAEFIPLSDAQGRTGFDAHVGERGVKLSGGQRQRIAIARVLLKDAPILILDEATSALDSEVEAAIQESLETLMQGKTVIAIAPVSPPSPAWTAWWCSTRAAWWKAAATPSSSPSAASTPASGTTRPAASSGWIERSPSPGRPPHGGGKERPPPYVTGDPRRRTRGVDAASPIHQR